MGLQEINISLHTMAEETDYSKMKIADLKSELKSKGLPVTGNKQDLIDRLKASGDIDLDDNDDLLDQDDSMTAEAIKEAEKELNVSSKTPKINRSVNITSPDPTTEENGDNKDTDPTSPEGKENDAVTANTENGDKENVVAAVVSPEKEKEGATVEDRIKARAERFGIQTPESDDAKKNARANRFGDMVSSGESQGKKIGEVPGADLDTLKKRAERFGTASSTVMKKAELSEAIKRRQERFGVISKDEPKAKIKSVNLPGVIGGNSVVLDEKMKARAERFKIA